MATVGQNIGCTKGDTFTFAITLLPYPDGTAPDLTGATASWALMDGNYEGATVLISKTSAPDIIVNQDEASNWQVVISLDPEDTVGVPGGTYFHQCRVVLSTGIVSHIEAGAFVLSYAGVP